MTAPYQGWVWALIAAIVTVIGGLSAAAQEAAPVLRNARYELRLTDPAKGGFELRRDGREPVAFNMRFAVARVENDPKPAPRPMAEEGNPVRYNVVTWEAAQAAAADSKAGIGKIEDERMAGDGFDPRILRGSTAGRTPDLFAAAPFDILVADSTAVSQGKWTFTFPATAAGALQAALHLPEGSGEPVIDFSWKPAVGGYYTVGFIGAPAYELSAVDGIFQPLIFQEKRFPQRSYQTLAYRCTIPACLVTYKGQTIAVAADPAEMPFDPLPVASNSRFGVAVRNPAGRAQPMVFAPSLGGAGSKMTAGDVFDFRLRLVVTPGSASDAFREIAEGLCRVTDFRRNVDWNLNETLDNMIAYGMSDYSRFREEMKGCAYDTDAPGTVKNVSSLNPLDIAIVTDDQAIFEHRAYPYIEYMLSREKFLFTLDETQKIQSPSYTLKGPCAPVSELVSLYNVLGRGSTALLELARQEATKSRARNLDDVDHADRWTNALWLYRATGDKAHLDRAVAGADLYIQRRIDTPQANFNDPDTGTPFFWTSFAPSFAPLMELYETTGEKRFLDAAHASARRFAMYTWALPVVPDESVVVNRGGMAPLYFYLKAKGHKQMEAAEETVPAWRLSEIGLTCESSGTSTGHRAIFMANYAPWLLRIAALKDDAFLKALARNSIVGRYQNFPGYHINTARTTVYEKADYPLRAHEELSVNSFHYNHSWPMMSMLLDYLVTDAVARSGGEISFPSQYIEGYAYLQNRSYGGGTGRFFGNTDAVLWMPRKLLKADSPQLNYVTARGAQGQLYLALMNESREAVSSQIAFNAELLPQMKSGRLSATIISAGGQPVAAEVVDGRMLVNVAPGGLTAVVIPQAGVQAGFQKSIMAIDQADAWKQGFKQFGKPAGRAMILPTGPNSARAFVYLEDAKTEIKSLEMSWSDGGEVRRITDTAFPWEFTVELPADASRFEFTLQATKADGTSHEWDKIGLSK
jgi:hypothetical protein